MNYIMQHLRPAPRDVQKDFSTIESKEIVEKLHIIQIVQLETFFPRLEVSKDGKRKQTA